MILRSSLLGLATSFVSLVGSLCKASWLCTGCAYLPPFNVWDFKPWYYLEGDGPFCEDDCMEDCDDIWGRMTPK